MKHLQISMLPTLTHPHETAGKTVVVVDVLRASTTIVAAMAAGVRQIVPCLEVDEALNLRPQIDPSALLGGERGGKPIPGFDLGNSPSEYDSSTVSGKTLCFTTTNGTRAMMRCSGAARVLIGSFVNLSATFQAVKEDSEVVILCAGTNGQVTREDVLFAGAFAVRAQMSNDAIELNDEARLAIDAWRSLNRNGILSTEELTAQLLQTQGGKNLEALGLHADIAYSANIDRFDIVPELDLSSWRIGLP